MKQCCDKQVDQRQKLVENTLAATMNSPMPELRPTILNRIVIMEGNGHLQRTLQELFSSEGYEVDLVPEGLAGLEMLRQRRPSAVIVDLQHPGPFGARSLQNNCEFNSRSAPCNSWCQLGGYGESTSAGSGCRRLCDRTVQFARAYCATARPHKACITHRFGRFISR